MGVSGQTKDRRVDRRILLPCNADPETLSATYADGEITIVMERKAGKKIAIKKTPVVFGHHPQAPSEKDEAAAAGPRERADKKETAHEPQEEEMTTAESKEPSLQRKSDARSAEEVKETGEEEWRSGQRTHRAIAKRESVWKHILGGRGIASQDLLPQSNLLQSRRRERVSGTEVVRGVREVG